MTEYLSDLDQRYLQDPIFHAAVESMIAMIKRLGHSDTLLAAEYASKLAAEEEQRTK